MIPMIVPAFHRASRRRVTVAARTAGVVTVGRWSAKAGMSLRRPVLFLILFFVLPSPAGRV